MRLILPGELAKHAISEGTKSVTSEYLQFIDMFHTLMSPTRVLISGCQVDCIFFVFISVTPVLLIVFINYISFLTRRIIKSPLVLKTCLYEAELWFV